MLYAVVAVAVLAIAAAIFLALRHRHLTAEHESLKQQNKSQADSLAALKHRFKDVVDVEAERQRVLAGLRAERASLDAEIGALQQQLASAKTTFEAERSELRTRIQRLAEAAEVLQAEVGSLEETLELQSFGLYKPHYDFDTSERYKAQLDALREKQKKMVKAGEAAICTTKWHVDGDYRKGERMTRDNLKVMLRAFNGECDAAVASVRYNNIPVMEKRIEKSLDAINKTGMVNSCMITRQYLGLKRAELHLAYEYELKKQEEKEEQRRIREEMREEERALREIERAQAEAERDAQRWEKALAKARAEAEAAQGEIKDGLRSQIEELEHRLAEAEANKERALSMAQQTRRGHVYVISNIGSFGEQVYKIGMTRRLEPMDRVKELGDASVPFAFDVHAIIYAEDAPALEATLHRTFSGRRVNRINERKEFFRVSLAEIEEAVREHHGEIEFTKIAEAAEYRQTAALLQEEAREPAPVEVSSRLRQILSAVPDEAKPVMTLPFREMSLPARSV